ncbi:TonB-dependent siderophore receptor [Acaryochloris marina]|uniref:TonB-dependent siderophore receptor n=1 Tax=Acaryochloris marina (strain MBIC 11017) TaxID=329726 RepID=A8ZKG4_ACAM1|nr:TonB-dependent siderophore receptor [Acaryochloris marina]ABW31664.1 TonB-dependent siderophore receptor [Acaryochloris marina MBIC11017]
MVRNQPGKLEKVALRHSGVISLMTIVSSGWGLAAVAQQLNVENAQSSPVESISTPIETPSQASPTVAEWMAQIEASQVEITAVRLQSTATGLQVVLETAVDALSLPTPTVSGNVLTVEIPNAVLQLPEGNDFEQPNPALGIDRVSVRSLLGDRVQIEIVGTNAPPVAEVSATSAGLVLAVTPGAIADGEDEEIEITVTADRDSSYVVPNASTATRTDTPLRDIPQSIQVIPKEVIEDQQVLRLNDALRNSSGVVSSSNDQRGQRFIIRGFNSGSVLRDGFRLTNGGTGNFGFPELSNYEQIEVLKGPAAILYGFLEPGGVINLVSKKPTEEPFYKLSFRAGNRDLYEPSFDISGPLTEDKRLAYRINGVYRTEDSIRDFDTSIQKFSIAPVLSWKISEQTDLLLSFDYSYDRLPTDFGGLPAIGNRIADVPFERITGEPGDDTTIETLRVGYQFEHRFSDAWKVRNSFTFYSYSPEFVSNLGFRINEATGDLNRIWVQNAQPIDNFELQTNVVGKFATGPVQHTLLAGVDLYRRDFYALGRIDFSPQPPFNIFNPVYGIPRPASFNDPLPQTDFSRTDSLGIFLQDQVTLLDNLHLLVGARYDTVRQTTEDLEVGNRSTQSDDAISPRAGIVYQPIEELSLFASYSTSFSPNSGTTIAGDLLDPERGEQFEVGLKTELLGGRFSGNLAFFEITKKNVATLDPNSPPGESFSIPTGEQRSRGIELDLIGELLPGWNLVANYAYTDAKITQSNDGIQGNRVFGVPRHNFNLWSTYEVQQGPLEGLGFGLGFNFVSDRFGDNANSFVLEDYFLTNAALFYERNNWKVALNLRNLFDVDFIDSSEGNRVFENRPGEGFTIIGSVSFEF